MDRGLKLQFKWTQCVSRYVEMENRIFPFSLRRVLPFPGISKPIHYLMYRQVQTQLHPSSPGEINPSVNTTRWASKVDPRLSLALSMQSNPGVYALLLGSGVSRSAKIQPVGKLSWILEGGGACCPPRRVRHLAVGRARTSRSYWKASSRRLRGLPARRLRRSSGSTSRSGHHRWLSLHGHAVAEDELSPEPARDAEQENRHDR